MKKRILTWLLAISMLGSLLTVPAGAAAVTKFSDVSDSYTATAVEALRLMGVLDGYGDGTFRADDPIDRAEVVTIVNRLLGREADEDYIADNHRRLVMFPDVSSRHWAYYNVLEAANAHTAILTAPETWDK